MLVVFLGAPAGVAAAEMVLKDPAAEAAFDGALCPVCLNSLVGSVDKLNSGGEFSSAAAGLKDDLALVEQNSVLDGDWEVGHFAGSCLTVVNGVQASGRVDVPGGEALTDDYVFLGQQPAAATEATTHMKRKESWSETARIQLMIVSLTGKTRIVMVDTCTSVLTLHDVVADELGLPGTCIHMTVGATVFTGVSSLEEAGVGANTVVRVRARIPGGTQPARAGGDFEQWTCTNPQCGANKCWPTRSRCSRCGAPRGFGVDSQPSQDPGRPSSPPPFPPLPSPASSAGPGHHPSHDVSKSCTGSPQGCRRSSSRLPSCCPRSKVQALELLKGDLECEFFWSCKLGCPSRRWEDALLRKRIEKDKTKDQLVKLDQRVENLREQATRACSSERMANSVRQGRGGTGRKG